MLRRTMVGMLWVSVALAFTGARLETLGYVSSREGLGAAISASARVNPHQPRRSCDCPRQISNFLPKFCFIVF